MRRNAPQPQQRIFARRLPRINGIVTFRRKDLVDAGQTFPALSVSDSSVGGLGGLSSISTRKPGPSRSSNCPLRTDHQIVYSQLVAAGAGIGLIAAAVALRIPVTGIRCSRSPGGRRRSPVGTLVVAAFAPPLTALAFEFGAAEYCALMFLGLVGAVVLIWLYRAVAG